MVVKLKPINVIFLNCNQNIKDCLFYWHDKLHHKKMILRWRITSMLSEVPKLRLNRNDKSHLFMQKINPCTLWSVLRAHIEEEELRHIHRYNRLWFSIETMLLENWSYNCQIWQYVRFSLRLMTNKWEVRSRIVESKVISLFKCCKSWQILRKNLITTPKLGLWIMRSYKISQLAIGRMYS